MKQPATITFDGRMRRNPEQAAARLRDRIRAGEMAEAFKPLADAARAVAAKRLDVDPSHVVATT